MGSDRPLCEATMVGARHYPRVQTHRMCNAERPVQQAAVGPQGGRPGLEGTAWGCQSRPRLPLGGNLKAARGQL